MTTVVPVPSTAELEVAIDDINLEILGLVEEKTILIKTVLLIEEAESACDAAPDTLEVDDSTAEVLRHAQTIVAEAAKTYRQG